MVFGFPYLYYILLKKICNRFPQICLLHCFFKIAFLSLSFLSIVIKFISTSHQYFPSKKIFHVKNRKINSVVCYATLWIIVCSNSFTSIPSCQLDFFCFACIFVFFLLYNKSYSFDLLKLSLLFLCFFIWERFILTGNNNIGWQMCYS